MSNQPPANKDDRRPMYPVIDPSSSSASPALSPMFLLGGGLPMTHLSPEEQRAEYRAEQEEEEGRKADEQEQDKEVEEDEEDRPRFYPVLSDPSNPNCCGISFLSTGAPLQTHLSPEEQHAAWRKEQEKKRVLQDKTEQAAAARGADGV
ncbi:hypothetical protein JCM9279_003272 [Rhodotorula babjevae]